jgi:hypothetical protein
MAECGRPGRRPPVSQLYFLHIPKTAGSSITRLLEDSWPAGALAPQRFVEELGASPAEEVGRYDVLAGHHGLLPVTERSLLITVLREPAERAWSHFQALRRIEPRRDGGELPSFDSFAAFIDDRLYQWMARDYQARWLAVAPEPEERLPLGLPPGVPPRDDDDLEQRALATLEDCALAGTAERLDDFVEALARLVGRPLTKPPRLNASPDGNGMPAEYADEVRARSTVDARLHALADEALDGTLATLPPLPREPEAELPYEHAMSDPLYGSGWHARLNPPDSGWHRWTGPDTRSQLRLPVRLAGAARLELSILSACDDEALQSLQISVQGRPLAHALEPQPLGVRAVADVELDPNAPLTVTLEVAHANHLVDAATGERSPDPAGLAVGTLAFRPRP